MTAKDNHLASRARRAWGTVRVENALTIRAPRERLVALYLEFKIWPKLWPATIRGVRLVRRTADATVVEVDHRTEGHVPNVIRPLSRYEVRLDEKKPRYDATFLNRFDPDAGGTRYTVIGEVRFKPPLALVAPLLRGIVRRRIARFVLEPMRAFAEHDRAA